MDALIVLVYLAVILMLGILFSFIAKQVRMPRTLLLLLLGITLGAISIGGEELTRLEQPLVIGIGTLALILLVFDSASRLRPAEVNRKSTPALKLIDTFLILSMLVVGFATALLFFEKVDISTILFSLMFSVIVIETDIGAVLFFFKEFAREKSSRILGFLETEANLNTAVIIIIPFLILDVIQDVDFSSSQLLSSTAGQIPVFLSQIIFGVGMGLMIGLVMLRWLRKSYSHHFSPVALVSAALLAYIWSETLNGNGILAIATMGFLFGNIYIKERAQLEEFSKMLSKSLEILIFILLGMIIKIPLTFGFVFKSLLIFLLLLGCRALAVFLSLRKEEHFMIRDKIFISLNMPKGIAVATTALMLSTYPYPSLGTILPLIVAVLFYSLVLSAIADVYARKFLEKSIEQLALKLAFSLPPPSLRRKEEEKDAQEEKPAKPKKKRKQKAKTKKKVKISKKPAKKVRNKKKKKNKMKK